MLTCYIPDVSTPMYAFYLPFTFSPTAYTSLPRELLRNHLINYSEPAATVPSPPSSSSSSSSSSGQNNKIYSNIQTQITPSNPHPNDSKAVHGTVVGGTGPGCSSCGPSTHTPRARKPEGNDHPGRALLIVYICCIVTLS